MVESYSDRGLAPVVGTALFVAIVVILAVVATLSLSSLSESALDSSAVHGAGSYDFSLDGANAPVLRVTPRSVNTRDSDYRIRVNGEDVYDQWDGKSELEIECLSPWDEVTVYTAKGSTTNLVKKYDVEKFLQCPDKIGDGRFKHAYFNGNKVNMKVKYDLPLAINPDGPSEPDDTYGRDTYERNIGNITFSNSWHYSKLYNDDDGTIEGYQKPVWLFILVDNAHWKDDPNAPSWANDRNWTDDPPTDVSPFVDPPGTGNYELNSGTIEAKPLDGVGEPTNDIYLVFKPVCKSEGKSKLKLIYYDAAYNDRIYMEDTEIIEDIQHYAQDDNTLEEEFDAPGIPC